MADRAKAWDRTYRQSLVVRLHQVRSELADASRRLTAAWALADVVATEALVARLGQLIDRVETAGYRYGAWLAPDAKSPAAPAAVAPRDQALTSALDELAATAHGLGSGSSSASLGLLGDLVDEVRDAWEARVAALAAAGPPTPIVAALCDLAPGMRLAVEGQEQAVGERVRWLRGDCSLGLTGPPPGRVLWQDRDEGLVLFEAQSLELAVPPSGPLTLDGTEYHLAWHDALGGRATSLTGRSDRVAERWLFVSDDGVRLWLERGAGGLATYRGLPVVAGGFQRL